MKACNHEIVILTLRAGSIGKFEVVYRDPGDSERTFIKRFFKHFIFLLFFSKIIRQGRFNIVHIHTLDSRIISKIVSKHPRVVISVWSDGIISNGLSSGSRLPNRLKTAFKKAAVITVTHNCIEEKIRLRVPEVKRIEIIPLGVDIARFTNLHRIGAGGDNVRFCYINPITHRYGADRVIEAFSRISNRLTNTSVVFIGTGDDEYIDLLRMRVKEAGMSKRIHFTTELTESEYDALLEKCDVLVQPTRRDMFDAVVLEALAAGLPVISTRIGGIRDIVIDGITGYTTPPGDVEALAKAMTQIVENRNLRQQMGNNARELISKLYGFKMHAERMEALYRELVKEIVI